MEAGPTTPRSHHSNQSIEDGFNDISLSPQLSPTPSRQEYLSPTTHNFSREDIGTSIPLPASPVTSPPPDIPRPPSRLLTRSPSPSKRSHASRTSRDGSISSSAPRRPSSTLSPHSPPTSPSPSRAVTTHPPRFVPFKPALPSATIALNGDVGDIDASAPFESIPLSNTPPPNGLPSSPTVVGTPERNGKRGSWISPPASRHSNAHSSTSSLPHSSSSRNGSLSVHGNTNGDTTRASGESNASTPPRRAAPPAHPHPPHLSADTASAPVKVPLPLAAQYPQGLGVKGTSTFEKVISQTRPSWLPPKDKIEDEEHYHQWSDMMAQAREHDRELNKMAETKRLEKERKLAMNTPKWETLLGSDFSAHKVKGDPELREMWFEGVPGYLRGKAWSLAVGNPLALSKDAYKTYLARAKRAIDSGRFPKDILDRLELDMTDTLPTLKLYMPGSPMRDDLKDFICAWVVYRSDEGLGYAPYITQLGAMLLLSSPPPQAFLILVNFLARPCLRAFYTQTIDEIEGYYRVFENLQADLFPKIFANCKALGTRLPESYFRSVFLEQVPFEVCCRLWDQIMLDGDGYIFRVALAIIGHLEPRLHFPDKEEIESILEGRNKATLMIRERERERARLRGEVFDEALDGKLSVFGLNDGAMFDWLENDGWKESRFERLVVRELPD